MKNCFWNLMTFNHFNHKLQFIDFFAIVRGTNETDLWIIIEKIERIVKGSGDWWSFLWFYGGRKVRTILEPSNDSIMGPNAIWSRIQIKVHLFWEGHKILRNLVLHRTNVRWRFWKMLWPSQNRWTLIWMRLQIVFRPIMKSFDGSRIVRTLRPP